MIFIWRKRGLAFPIVDGEGQVSVGPVFLMEKHNAGFNKVSHNWQYTLIMPNGQTVGTTNGKGKGIGQILLQVPQFRGRGSGCDDVPAEEIRVN